MGQGKPMNPKREGKPVVKGGLAKMTHEHKDMLVHTKMQVNMYIPICNIFLVENRTHDACSQRLIGVFFSTLGFRY